MREPARHDVLIIDTEPGALERAVEKVTLRLVDATAALRPRPLTTIADGMLDRIQQVANDLESIRDDLLMLIHVEDIEDSDIESQLLELDAKLAAGWTPPSRSVNEVIADLKARR